MHSDIQHPWLHYTWHRSDGRYYCCSLQQNLFQEWVLIRRWGVVRSRHGGAMEIFCRDYKDGLKQLEMVAKRRKQKGYSSNTFVFEALP
jgi:predicted DNA-binding WGR domain protein